eukprot:scaffold22599_cov139-Cylindrotheca_fusiformis.AAC.20
MDSNGESKEAVTPTTRNTSKNGRGRTMKSNGENGFSSPLPRTDEETGDDLDEVSNPQSATSALRDAAEEEDEQEDPVVMIDMDDDGDETTESIPLKSPSTAAKRNNQRNPKRQREWKLRKRGRRVRVANIHELTTAERNDFPPLPKNQFKTTLRRRAIRKSTDQKGQNTNPDEYGDISLGMKLIVVGGRVIVQSLNALADGRASPAQLTGVIKRGDVLLAIGNTSLVQLPIDKLMAGLKPLSSADPDGKYKKVLELRFQSAAGLRALKGHEEAEDRRKRALSGRQESLDPANEMFSIFPMADQLSGAPLFDDQHREYPPEPKEEEKIHEETEEGDSSEDQSSKGPISDQDKDPDSIISTVLARETKAERERFTSEFFDWSDTVSQFLKRAVRIIESTIGDERIAGMTQTERMELGRKVMRLAKTLSEGMEEIDKGKDLRSFKVWSSNFSLRSTASTRRRYILDTVSLRSHRHQEPEPEFDESVGSEDGSGSLDGVDGDALLLGLAAHDEIWQKQVVDFLKESIAEMENASNEDEEKEEETKSPDMDSALTKQLGTFLFGENMTKIISKKKRSHAIPPAEITTVLFDLTTNLATSAPDEITVFGPSSVNQSFPSSHGPMGKSTLALKTNRALANQYLLDRALPVWLESFRPFGWEQRRVLWPRMLRTTSPGGTIPSDADSVTLDGSVGSSPSSRSAQGPKDIREVIEDQELDIETRSETCFLVTYYYTQKVIGQYSVEDDGQDTSRMDKDAVTFVKKYGAYLQIHSSLSCSAAAKASAPIKEILQLARHDPTHRDAVREIQKSSSLVFYDTAKLSAALSFLHSIRTEKKIQRREVIRSLCVSAYPDIRPWQVREVCFDSETPNTPAQKTGKDKWLKEYYYGYLSMLLHPNQGNESARSDGALVKVGIRDVDVLEWCEWSVGLDPLDKDHVETVKEEWRKNFFDVAARSSSDHLRYRRDLKFLLELSMKIDEKNLALDLSTEILESKRLLKSDEMPELVLSVLRQIGVDALGSAIDKTTEAEGFRLLKRVLKLFQQMSDSDSPCCHGSIVVSHELHQLFQEWKSKSGSAADDSRMFQLIDFVVDQSAPEEVLRALIQWTSDYEVGHAMFPRLDVLLRQGVHDALKSGQPSLFRLQQARQNYSEENTILSSFADESERTRGGIWELMSSGELMITK